MPLQDYDFTILSKLGLTKRQTQVYIALVQSGRTTAARIAKILQIDRAEVYRSITTLERMSLVQRILGNPTIFLATPISEALNILLKRQSEEHNQVQAKAKALVQELVKTCQEEKKHEVGKYTLKFHNDSREGFDDAVSISQSSIDVITNWSARFKSLLLTKSEVFRDAIERGVRFRYITDIPQREKIPSVFRALNKGFSIKRVQSVSQLTVVITDKKEVCLLTTEMNDQGRLTVQHLLLTDPVMVELFQDYFELKWCHSKKIVY